MDAIFSTREIAIAVWSIIFVIFCFISPKIRKSALGVLKAIFKIKLIVPFIWIIVYTTFLVFLFTFLPFWKWLYIKDISIWVLFSGAVVCYKTVQEKINDKYFRSIIFDNLKLAVLVEFVISSFTFSLLAELIILPAISFLVILDSFAGVKAEYASVKKLTSILLALAGITIIGFTLKVAVNTYQIAGTIDLLVSFFVPFIFSVLFVPVAYMFAIYTRYEMLFLRMSFKEPTDRKVKHNHRKAVLRACGLSYKKIDIFQQEYVKYMYVSIKQEDFNGIISRFITTTKQNNPS